MLSPNGGEPVAHPTDGASAPVEERAQARTSTFARSLLADGEIIILELKPSLWFIPLVSAPLIGFGIMVLLAANVSAVERLSANCQPVLRYAGLWIIALRLVWAMFQWLSRTYVLTDRRVIRQKGVLNIQVFECRLDRLQNTFIQRTLVQRILGIGTIFFATAGTGQVEAMWQHIHRPAHVHREIASAISRFQKMMGNSAV